jgi:uncharacterized protein (DUF1015 family)
MAEVRPFRGLRYASNPTARLGDLVCPPYDVISPSDRETLAGRSPHNAVHIELPEGGPDERYAAAARDLAKWREDGVLVTDERPSYYVVRHRFNHLNVQWERWELTALVRLEEFERRVVLPHEETTSGPKADRLRLMEACHANLSPVMCAYQDPDRLIRSGMERVMGTTPDAVAEHDDGTQMAQWIVDASELDGAVQSVLADAPLFIADGHHRYETAIRYRDLARQNAGAWQEQDAFNYAMVTLIDFDDPGLLVLPYHRTLGRMDPPTLTAVRNKLLDVFQIQTFDPQPTTPGALEEAVVRDGKGTSLGLLGPDGEGPYLLTLKGAAVEGGLRESEGWVLHQEVLEPVLEDALADYITYAHDPVEAWESVVESREQMAFFLKSFPMDLFQAVVSAGQRLPPKSTFFHPKLPTGMVFNVLEGEV